MATSPSTENYALGKGILYFNRMLADGSYEGERDLGNAPSFSLGFTVDQLDHFSSRADIAKKDKIVSKSVVGAVKFTLDEINTENLNLYYFGTDSSTVQSADDSVSYTITANDDVVAYGIIDTGYKRIGIWKFTVTYEAGKSHSDLPNAAKLGNTSNASPTNYWQVIHATTAVNNQSTVYVDTKTGTGLSAGAGDVYVGTTKIATYSTEPAFDNTKVLIKHNTTYYLQSATEFTVSSADGRIRLGSAPTAVATDQIIFAVPAFTSVKVTALTSKNIEGTLRFVSNNPEGDNHMITVWRVYLKPDGEIGYISEDWQTMSFTGEVLVDEVNHPDNPYFIIEEI